MIATEGGGGGGDDNDAQNTTKGGGGGGGGGGVDVAVLEKDELEIGKKEAGFLIGREALRNAKVQKVSNTRIEIADSTTNPETSIVCIRGTETNRAKARRYVAWVLRQPEGKIFCDLGDDVVRENVSVVDVPPEAMAFVVGAKGRTLRNVEEEYGTLMFFGHTEKDQPETSEKLIIAAIARIGAGAELKVMSSVETKVEGYFVDYEKNELKQQLMQPGDGLKDGFSYDQFPFTEEEFSYAVGKFGKVRRKLAKASGCIMEYVGRVAIMAGNKEQRARCWDYTNWLMKQRRNNGTCSVDPSARNDCEICDVPGSIDLPRLQGNCHKVEEATGTFIFTTDFEKPVVEGEDKTLLICSHDASAKTQGPKNGGRFNRRQARRVSRHQRPAEVEEDTSEVAAPRNTTKPVATSKWDGVLEAISANTPTTRVRGVDARVRRRRAPRRKRVRREGAQKQTGATHTNGNTNGRGRPY